MTNIILLLILTLVLLGFFYFIQKNETKNKKIKHLEKLSHLSLRIKDFDAYLLKISKNNPSKLKNIVSETIEKYDEINKIYKYKSVMKNYEKTINKLESINDNVILKTEIKNIEKKYSLINEIIKVKNEIEDFDKEVKRIESLHDFFVVKHEVKRIKECALELKKIYAYKDLITNFEQVVSSLKKLQYPNKIKQEVERVIKNFNIRDRIKVGMSKNEIIHFFNEPVSFETKKLKNKTKETLIFNVDDKEKTFIFHDNKLVGFQI